MTAVRAHAPSRRHRFRSPGLIVKSNSNATFKVVLRAGSYIVRSISGAKTTGAAPYRVRARAHATTKTDHRALTAKIQPS